MPRMGKFLRNNGPNNRALFIPDIDKWQKWSRDIRSLLSQVDYAFLDATFFAADELPNRDMSQGPHPFVEESLQLLANLPAAQKKVEAAGFNVARKGMVFEL